MSISGFISNLLAVLLVVVMLGIGLSITMADLKRTITRPKAMLIGLFCQAIILPAAAFLMCVLAPLPAEFKIGLILLAASPGGPSSNLYSLLAGGDVALNLALTAFNSFLNIVTMPIYVGLALWLFRDSDSGWFVAPGKIGEVFFLIMVPTIIGMLINSRRPLLAEKLSRVIKMISVVALALTVCAIVNMNWNVLVEHSKSVGWAILLFNVLSLLVGYGFARAAKLPREQSIAISFEIGIHNASLALYLAMNVLKNQMYAIPPAIYSVLMYFTAGALCFYFKRESGKNQTGTA